ncbi:amidohydrolase family protein [Chloroflexota bacterium]
MAEDYFIIEHEGHFSPDMMKEEEHLKHYRDYQRYKSSRLPFRIMTANNPKFQKEFIEGAMKMREILAKPMPESLIELMDHDGVDMLHIVPHRHGIHMKVDPKGTNMAFMIEACEKYPDRLRPGPVFEPSTRGVDQAIWELEYMVKEHGATFGKMYLPGEAWLPNDKRYWPFYEKAQELGFMLGMHTGHGYVYGANTNASMPRHLDDVCREFYDLKILAFHFGWPWHDDLNCLAGTYPNLYIGTSFLNNTITCRPRFFAKLLGDAIMYAGVEKVIWSHEGALASPSINAFKEFQFSESLQEDYGYAPLTTEDKAKIFGLNMAGLLGIEPTKRAKPLP